MRPLIDASWALIRAVNSDLANALPNIMASCFDSAEAEAFRKVQRFSVDLAKELNKQQDKILPEGSILLSPATINCLHDLVHQIEGRFLIEHSSPDSPPAEQGRRSLQALVKLVDEIFPCHPHAPVSCLEAQTAAETGAGAESASKEGLA